MLYNRSSKKETQSFGAEGPPTPPHPRRLRPLMSADGEFRDAVYPQPLVIPPSVSLSLVSVYTNMQKIHRNNSVNVPHRRRRSHARSTNPSNHTASRCRNSGICLNGCMVTAEGQRTGWRSWWTADVSLAEPLWQTQIETYFLFFKAEKLFILFACPVLVFVWKIKTGTTSIAVTFSEQIKTSICDAGETHCQCWLC